MRNDWRWYAGVAGMVVAMCAIWGLLVWHAFAQ